MAGIDWVALAIYAAIAAAVSGISYGVQTALAPNPRKPQQSGRIDQLRTIVRDNTAPIRVVYGTFRASGVLLFARTTTKDGIVKAGGQYLHFALALAHGPVADIYNIQLNDEPADSSRFADLALLTPFMGFVDQRMLTGPLSLGGIECKMPTEWLEVYRPLRSVAWLHGLLRNNPKIFQGGAPNVRATVDGRLLYDSRDASQSLDDKTTHRFSNNWALCVRDFLTSSEYGFGASQSEICEECFLAAANRSDELMDAPSDRESDEEPMPQIARYTCDGLFESDEQPIDILQRILAAGAGAANFYGGQWHIKAGGTETPAVDINTGDDIVLTPNDLRDDDDLQVVRLPGRSARINTMRGTFINPGKQFIPDSFPPVTDERFFRDDGNVELSQQLQLDFTQHIDRARYVAGIFLRQSRMMQVRWPGKPHLAQIVPMSVVKVTHAYLGWTEKLFLVRDRERTETGAINLLLEEYTDDNFVPVEDGAPLPDPTDLPPPFLVLPPTDVEAAEAVQLNPDGTRTSKVVVTWTPPEGSLVDGYEIAWRNVSDAVQSTRYGFTPAPASRFEILNLAEGEYAITVRATLNAAKSDPVATQVRVTYITAPPPDPINLRVHTTSTGTRVLTWGLARPAPADLLGFRVAWVAGTVDDGLAAWSSANVFPQLIVGQSFETSRPSTPGTYTFLVRAIDSSFVYSNNVADVVVAIPPAAPDVLADTEWSERGWAGTHSKARVTDAGELQSLGSYTWDDLTTWDDWGSWEQNPRTLVYETKPVVFDSERAVVFDTQITGRNYVSAVVTSRVRRATDNAFDAYTLRAGAVCQAVQFRVVLYTDGTAAPVLERFRTTARERIVADTFDDVNMVRWAGNQPADGIRPYAVILRGESSTAELAAGAHANTNPVTSGGVASLEIDADASVLLNGTSHYVEVADAEGYRLQGPTWTVEFLCYLPTVGSVGRIVSKGDDWSLGYFGGNWQFDAAGFVGDNPQVNWPVSSERKLHHIAVVRNAGTTSVYDWGELKDSVLSDFTLAAGADPLTFGASKVGGVADNFTNVALEQVRIWSIARTPDELRAWADVDPAPDTPGLVSHWRCAEGTGSTIRDLVAANNGTVQGAAATWVRMAERLSPTIDLNILPPVYGAGWVTWQGDAPAGTSLVVEVSTQSAGGWTATTGGGVTNPLPNLTPNQSLAGRVLRCRQFFYSTDVAATPSLVSVSAAIAAWRPVGQLVVTPRLRMADLRQASITAVQNTPGRPAWRLEAKGADGARFSVWDADTGDPFDALVDVELRGSRLL